MGFKITVIKLGLKSLLSLAIVWLISFPLYAVDVDGDGLQDYQIEAGFWQTCAIDDNGVQCWGRNGYGETDVPTNLLNPVAVSAGRSHTCAIDDNGVSCWGSNQYGKTDVPTNLVDPMAVSAGGYHTCTLADADDAHTKTMAVLLIPMEHYPSTADKQVLQTILDSSSATANEKIIATAIMNLEHYATDEDKVNLQTVINDASSTADEKILALIIYMFSHYPTDADIEKLQLIGGNGVQCWGRNNYGQTTVPTDLVNPIVVTAGLDHTCTLDDNGVHCWGDDGDRQTTVPTDLVNPVAVSAGAYHTCAIDDNGVNCWGYDPSVPTGLVNPVVVSAGYDNTCVIDDNGLYCTKYSANVPPALVNPVAVSAGRDHACAIDDGGLWCWGFNTYGQSNVPTGLVFDRDGDGVEDKDDAYPLDATETLDTDSDGTGNNTDTDDDNDGILDNSDAFPLDATETIDTDSDGTGNNADTDDDNDNVLDDNDAFPLDATETVDTDSDGTGNNADTDDDGDGVIDSSDEYPLISLNGLTDTDGDGVPNDCDSSCIATGMGADTDDDGDGTLDVNDPYPLVAPPSLLFNYAGNTDKPLAGISLTHTESDGTVRIFTTDASGQVTLPVTTTNPYTLSASLTDSAEDPVSLIDAIWILQHDGELRTLTADQLKAADVSGDGEVDILDAIWILQHLGELRTLSPSLVFLDAATGEALSETIYNITDTPSITVIRMGDVDQSYDPNAVTGVSLSANRKILAIGALGNDDSDSNPGHNRIYDWDGRAWVQRGSNIALKLKSDSTDLNDTDFNWVDTNEPPYLDFRDNEVELNQNEVSNLTFTYANSSTPIAGVKVIMTESDGKVTILITDVNGQITLPSTSNTYTLSASLSETGDDPISLIDAIHILQYGGELRTLTSDQKTAADVNADGEVDILDAIWILQHLGELRTLDSSLVFLDANTGNSLSATTFSPGDTPNINVIRKGDVDGDFDPSSTNAQDLDWVITTKSTAYDYSEVNITFTSSATISEVVLSGDEGGLTLVSFEDNAIKLLTPIVFQDTEFAYSLTITDSANNTVILDQTMLVKIYEHPLDAFAKLSTVNTENFSTDDYAVFNFSFDAIHTAEIYTETVCYEGCREQDDYFASDLHNGMWGDFNGDGHEDFVSIWAVFPHSLERENLDTTQSNIEIYLNNGEGRLIRNRDIYVNGAPPRSHFLYRTAVADFNKDGIDDIFSVPMALIQKSTSGETVKSFVFSQALLLSTPEGKFRDASSDIEGNGPATSCIPSDNACTLWASHSVSSGDINGDGYPDINTSTKLFLNENGEKFVDVTDQLPVEWEDTNSYQGPMSAEIKDFNNDGFGDLVMFWADNPGLDDPPDPEILVSNGTANISEWTRQYLPIGYFGDGLTKFNNKFSGDIDGDGDLDIVLSTTRTNPAYYRGRYIQVLVNDGDANFTDNSFAALGEQPRAGDYGDSSYSHSCDAHGEGSIFLRDYDGDGDLDIIDVSPGGSTPTSCASPSIFLNNGAGVFSELEVDWAWVQGPQVDGWDVWHENGAHRSPEGRTVLKTYPVNLDNKNQLDFVSQWKAPAQSSSTMSVKNIRNTYQIMSKK